MSRHDVISSVSEALRGILWEAFSTDNELQQIFPPGAMDSEIINFKQPVLKDNSATDPGFLSIWLYQITENEFVKNQPMLKGSGTGDLKFPPMALNLFYLITPCAFKDQNSTPNTDLNIIGKTLQTLYDNAVVYLQFKDGNGQVVISEELRIIFCRLTLEELTRVWEALQEPYRLSVCYQVRVTHIDSFRVPNSARIIEQTLNEEEMVTI